MLPRGRDLLRGSVSSTSRFPGGGRSPDRVSPAAPPPGVVSRPAGRRGPLADPGVPPHLAAAGCGTRPRRTASGVATRAGRLDLAPRRACRADVAAAAVVGTPCPQRAGPRAAGHRRPGEPGRALTGRALLEPVRHHDLDSDHCDDPGGSASRRGATSWRHPHLQRAGSACKRPGRRHPPTGDRGAHPRPGHLLAGQH